ncbi:MAG TPA: sodium:calcium antiporter [Ktedonobacterales bacterium]|nr:sodium:calcium antiporter [Ktedonobacterales bacterium]
MLLALGVAMALLAGGIVLLLRGADWFMDGVGDLARVLGVSALALGAVLAGLEPEEMLTAAVASGRGAPDLAVGNVIGTNVTIVTLALGLAALIAPIAISRAVRRQALLATLVSAVPVGLLVFGFVSRLAGALLLALFVGYTLALLRGDRTAVARLAALEGDDHDDDGDADQRRPATRAPARWRLVGVTLAGLVAMAVGGPALVEGALRLAALAGVGGGVVGLSIVSLGTGAEMIALGVSAARKRASDILVGGIIGSFAYNLLVTLGLAAVVRPLPVAPEFIRLALPIMVAAHLVLLGLIWRGRMGRMAGALFVAAYVAYLALVVIAR